MIKSTQSIFCKIHGSWLNRVWLLLLASLLCATGLYAQDLNQVSGKVTSTEGEPLAGASVVEVGTTNGYITDIDGNYTLTVAADASLSVSFIGYKEQIIAVGSRQVVNILLEYDYNVLDEVVAIGYGVQKKKLNTGANLQVKGEQLERLSQINPLQALQGQTPGVQIASTSGQPGSDMKVTVRGLGTIGNSGPLFIIDGIPGDLSVINAADIESIDVLKDAASAAIYGAQAANGVVLVTTKQGVKGKGTVSFDAYYGIQNVRRKANMLNASEYKTIMNEQALNSGSGLYDFDSMEGLADTDWIDNMFKDNAKTQSYNLGVTGGGESSIYSMSLSYLSQEGIVGGKDVSDYERYGFRINSEHKLYKDILKVGQHLNFNYIKNRGIAVGNQYHNALRGAFATSPLSPVYSDNNLYDSPYNDTTNSPWYNGDGNPYGSMMTKSNNKNDVQKLMADIYAELEPIKKLKIRSVFGINYYSSEYRSFDPLYRFSAYDYNESHTTTNQNMSKGHTLTWINTAGYDFTIANDHELSLLAGMEIERYQGTYLSGSNWNLLSQFNDFSHAYLDNTTGQAHLDDDGNVVETKSVGGRPEHEFRRISYFGRIGYNYKERYLLNATVRADGSSKFASGNRWGYFTSVSAGWVITNESFMQSAVNSRVLEMLKLRASWGQVGNQDIAHDQYTAPINTSTGFSSSNPAAYYNFGTNKTNVPGAYPSRLANPDVKWETSQQLNIGIDAYMLRSRLGVNVDFYIKDTKDWLVTAPILATAGTNPPVINGGDVRNTGVELAISWRDNIGQFNYHVSVNGSYNRNKVGSIPTLDGTIHGDLNMLYDNSEEFYRAQNGHSIGYFWGYETDGIFQNEQEIADWRAANKGILQANVKPGDVRYVDQNGDGKIDSSDKINLGNGMPDYTFGFNLGFDYKGFDFSVNGYGSLGNKIVQSYRNHANKQANYTTSILDRWTGEGTSNKMPRVTESNVNWQFSDLYVQDGDFLRISNITLGYDFSRIIRLNAISQCRFYFTVQNPFTFTKYDGMDPEIGYGTTNWISGVDLGYYPRPVTFLFGVNLKF